jgi:hypothetical protein
LQVYGTQTILIVKTNAKKEISRSKVQVVVQGYTMRERVDYDLTFALMAHILSIHLLIAIACHNRWKVYQANCLNAYLNGFSQKTVLVSIPKHWNELVNDDFGKDGEPVILEKSLYGAPDARKN